MNLIPKNVRPGQLFAASPLFKKGGQVLNKGLMYVIRVQNDTIADVLLNKPTYMTVPEAVGYQVLPWDSPLFLGGLEHSSDIHYLHTSSNIGAEHIADGIYMGGEFDELLEKLNFGMLAREDVKFVAGYCEFDAESFDYMISSRDWLWIKKPFNPLRRIEWGDVIGTISPNYQSFSTMDYQEN